MKFMNLDKSKFEELKRRVAERIIMEKIVKPIGKSLLTSIVIIMVLAFVGIAIGVNSLIVIPIAIGGIIVIFILSVNLLRTAMEIVIQKIKQRISSMTYMDCVNACNDLCTMAIGIDKNVDFKQYIELCYDECKFFLGKIEEKED